MTEPVLIRDPMLAEIVRRVVEVLRPERIYLFGSKARGDGDRDSDYDLMVIVNDSGRPDDDPELAAYSALIGLGVSKDVIVWTRDEFDNRARFPASFPAAILREGNFFMPPDPVETGAMAALKPPGGHPTRLSPRRLSLPPDNGSADLPRLRFRRALLKDKRGAYPCHPPVDR